MKTQHAISLRKFIWLAALASSQSWCYAFCPLPASLMQSTDGRTCSTSCSVKVSAETKNAWPSGSSVGEQDNDARSHPIVVDIKNHEDYVKFLEEDDRLCVIKFYANWCKSCQRFGVKFRHLSYVEGDHIDIEGSITHMGKVRFAQAEYSASAKLCKALRVRKLPTVHMYRKGRGKIADMCCKPSQFQLVVDKIHCLLDDPSATDEDLEKNMGEGSEANGMDDATVSFDENKIGNLTFDEAMSTGSSLADEIMGSLRKDEEGGRKQKEKSWFPFSF